MKKTLHWLVIAAIWLLVWQFAYLLIAKDILISSPLDTVRELGTLAATSAFWLAVLTSMGRILAGFLLGVVACVLLAIVTSLSSWCYDFFKLPISIIKATPVASFIILILVWLPYGQVPVFTAFLIVLPVLWGNVSEGIRKTDRQLLEMAAGFKLSPLAKLRHIYIPSVLPYFMAGSTTGMGMAWKAGITAEVICIPKLSIGSALYSSKIYLDTPALFAWTVTVILLSVLLEAVFVRLVARAGFVPRAKEGRL